MNFVLHVFFAWCLAALARVMAVATFIFICCVLCPWAHLTHDAACDLMLGLVAPDTFCHGGFQLFTTVLAYILISPKCKSDPSVPAST